MAAQRTAKGLTLNDVLWLDKVYQEAKERSEIMADFNQTTLVGRLTKDPESRTSKSGSSVVNFSIAVNRHLKDGSDKANFFDVIVFGQTAAFVSEYLKKGDLVLVSGSLEQQTWETQDGQRRSRVVIIGYNVQSLGAAKAREEKKEEMDELKPIGMDEIPF